MRYVSEQFKEKQNRLIRPPLKMRFEIATDVNQRWLPGANSLTAANFTDFDFNVALVKSPSACTNDYHYAVVGDGVGVDDPNRICAPVSVGGSFPDTSHLIPFGVTKYANAGEEVVIGSTTSTSLTYNFLGGNAPFVIAFTGGLIPDEIKIERVQSGAWVLVDTIPNPDLKREIYYSFSTYAVAPYRFKVKNSTKSGRFQFNWIYSDLASYPTRGYSHIIFENNYISSASIDETGDLSSQSLPSYEMTVTCLDPDGQYAPETEHWGREFSGGQPCYFSAGYEVDGIVEYAPLFFGSLSREPSYDNGKITFNLSVPMGMSEGVYLGDNYVNGRKFDNYAPNDTTLVPGNSVKSEKFLYGTVSTPTLFDGQNDIFVDSTDGNNSVLNHYFSLPFGEARQLYANALGGYIRIGFGRFDLFNTNNIQYKNFEDYLTRYEQVKATLDSQPKVGAISVTRNENTVSADYVDIEATTRITVGTSGFSYVTLILPEWSYGKMEIIDYQAASPSATFTQTWAMGNLYEKVLADGSVEYKGLGLKSSVTTTVKPIVRFYKVDNKKYEETESVNTSGTETYINDNDMVTNSYIANKVKRVARFMSDVSNQYEVDVVQDLRYELGDVIRLETEKNVFKTCVITALKFNLPGSTGHVTCRKIFAIEDSANAMSGIKNAELIKYTNGDELIVTESDRDTVVVGLVKYNNDRYYIVAGASSIKKVQGGSTTIVAPNIKVTDNNAHVWNCYYFNANNTIINFTPVDLGTYNTMIMNNIYAYGVVTLITKLYEEQNMTSPVDYDCSYVVN